MLTCDPTAAAWLVRTAVAAGRPRPAEDVVAAADRLAEANPGLPGLVAAAEPPAGLRTAIRISCGTRPRARQPWARASAFEGLGVLLGAAGPRGRTVRCLDERLSCYAAAGAERRRRPHPEAPAADREHRRRWNTAKTDRGRLGQPDRDRAADLLPRRPRAHQPAHRRSVVHQRPHRGVPPAANLPQTQRPFARRTGTARSGAFRRPARRADREELRRYGGGGRLRLPPQAP